MELDWEVAMFNVHPWLISRQGVHSYGFVTDGGDGETISRHLKDIATHSHRRCTVYRTSTPFYWIIRLETPDYESSAGWLHEGMRGRYVGGSFTDSEGRARFKNLAPAQLLGISSTGGEFTAEVMIQPGAELLRADIVFNCGNLKGMRPDRLLLTGATGSYARMIRQIRLYANLLGLRWDQEHQTTVKFFMNGYM